MATRYSRKKRFAYGLALTVLITLLVAGLCELLIRLTHPEWSQPRLRLSAEITHDSGQGWLGQPGFDGQVGPDRTGIRINAQGYRDEDFVAKLEQAEAGNRMRLLFIGDSLTYGYRIPESVRLSEQVAAVASARGIGIETFNAGMPGYGTGQEYRAMENLVPVVRPHVVVLWYCSNDVGDAAVPYDYRLAHRVYKPFYDLEGRLVCHQTVPVRFSHRVEQTWLGAWELCYFVDWLRYRHEDRRFAPFIHLWDSPLLRDPPALTPAQQRLFQHNLGAMAQVPELRPFFEVNLPRNLALWDRMKALCQEHGARLIMLMDPGDGTETTARVMQQLTGLDFDVLEYGDRLDPYRPWGGVWGDGHPNAVQNQVAAVALVDHLDGSRHRVNFRQAPWIDAVPTALDLARAPSREVLNGEWGAFGVAGREAGMQARCMLRAPPDGEPAELLIRGTCHAGDAHVRLWCGGNLVGELTGRAASPFQLIVPAPDDHRGLLLVRIEAQPNVTVREIRVRPQVTPGAMPSK